MTPRPATAAADGFCTAWSAETRAVPAGQCPGAWTAFALARHHYSQAAGLDRRQAAAALAGRAGTRIARTALDAIRRGKAWQPAIRAAVYLDRLHAEAEARHTERTA